MPVAQPRTLLALRVSLGLLKLVSGADKFANPEHGVAVAHQIPGRTIDAAHPGGVHVRAHVRLDDGAAICANRIIR